MIILSSVEALLMISRCYLQRRFIEPENSGFVLDTFMLDLAEGAHVVQNNCAFEMSFIRILLLLNSRSIYYMIQPL